MRRGDEEPELVPAGDEPLELAAVPDPPETEPLAEAVADLDTIDVDAPRVAILVSDKADLLTMERAENELEQRGIRSEKRVMSADEEPGAIATYTENAQLRGIRVIIAGAGPAARLPGMTTAHTQLPVIGVPLTSAGAERGQLDPLLSDGPAPPGEPVAWVGLDDAGSAAVLAARILAA